MHGLQPESSSVLALAGSGEEAKENKPCHGVWGEQPRTGLPQPHIPAPDPASSPGVSEVPFSWAQTDAGHFSPGLRISLWFRDIYLLFIIMGKKMNQQIEEEGKNPNLGQDLTLASSLHSLSK